MESIKKDEIAGQGVASGVAQVPPSSNISISDLFANVNPKDESFYKYIPKGFLEGKTKRYSLSNELSDKYPNLNLDQEIKDIYKAPAVKLNDGSIVPFNIIKDRPKYARYKPAIPTATAEQSAFIATNKIKVERSTTVGLWNKCRRTLLKSGLKVRFFFCHFSIYLRLVQIFATFKWGSLLVFLLIRKQKLGVAYKRLCLFMEISGKDCASMPTFASCLLFFLLLGGVFLKKALTKVKKYGMIDMSVLD